MSAARLSRINGLAPLGGLFSLQRQPRRARFPCGFQRYARTGNAPSRRGGRTREYVDAEEINAPFSTRHGWPNRGERRGNAGRLQRIRPDDETWRRGKRPDSADSRLAEGLRSTPLLCLKLAFRFAVANTRGNVLYLIYRTHHTKLCGAARLRPLDADYDAAFFSSRPFGREENWRGRPDLNRQPFP
jgi:hypothetical protein